MDLLKGPVLIAPNPSLRTIASLLKSMLSMSRGRWSGGPALNGGGGERGQGNEDPVLTKSNKKGLLSAIFRIVK